MIAGYKPSNIEDSEFEENEKLLILEEENSNLRKLLSELNEYLVKLGTFKPLVMDQCRIFIEKIKKQMNNDNS